MALCACSSTKIGVYPRTYQRPINRSRSTYSGVGSGGCEEQPLAKTIAKKIARNESNLKVTFCMSKTVRVSGNRCDKLNRLFDYGLAIIMELIFLLLIYDRA